MKLFEHYGYINKTTDLQCFYLDISNVIETIKKNYELTNYYCNETQYFEPLDRNYNAWNSSTSFIIALIQCDDKCAIYVHRFINKTVETQEKTIDILSLLYKELQEYNKVSKDKNIFITQFELDLDLLWCNESLICRKELSDAFENKLLKINNLDNIDNLDNKELDDQIMKCIISGKKFVIVLPDVLFYRRLNPKSLENDINTLYCVLFIRKYFHTIERRILKHSELNSDTASFILKYIQKHHMIYIDGTDGIFITKDMKIDPNFDGKVLMPHSTKNWTKYEDVNKIYKLSEYEYEYALFYKIKDDIPLDCCCIAFC